MIMLNAHLKLRPDEPVEGRVTNIGGPLASIQAGSLLIYATEVASLRQLADEANRVADELAAALDKGPAR